MAGSFETWAAATYPHFPSVTYGLSGATLLLDALGRVKRRTLVLPAFLCADLPAMGLRAGMRVVHIDVDPRTLLMAPDMLARCLAETNEADTVLLVDHAFGYPCAGLNELREKYPRLLIVEDCVRALGSEISGRPVGQIGDWVLFSMYKTTMGNTNGAVLLTRSSYDIASGPTSPGSLREWAAGVPAFRAAHGLLKRFQPETLMQAEEDDPRWSPLSGTPSALCRRRFDVQAARLASDRAARRAAGREIEDALRGMNDVQPIELGPACAASGFFLSFTVTSGSLRNALLARLRRGGHFLTWAWDAVPAFYKCFAGTFPYGSSGSVFLARHVCHVPLDQYVSSRRRRRLIAALQTELSGR